MLIKPAATDDLPVLWALCSACLDDPLWQEPCTQGSLREMLEGRTLPPDGSPEFHYMLLLTDKATGRHVGLAAYYTAYPQSDSNWIGLFLLHPDFRRQGLGREFISAYCAECALQGYRQVGLGVLPANTSAMRFWVELGFDKSSTPSDERAPIKMKLIQPLENPWQST